MFEKGKLSFWDIGTYLTIGLFFILVFSIYFIHGFKLTPPEYLSKVKDFSATVVLITPIILLLIGMIIEPIANITIKLIEKFSFMKPRKGRSLDVIIAIVDKIIPNEEIKKIRYRYCKSVVELNFENSNHEIFLARFGFYRSASFIFICIFILNIFIFKNPCFLLFINLTTLFTVYIFIRRSQMFLSHMEYSIYTNYIALNKNHNDNEASEN